MGTFPGIVCIQHLPRASNRDGRDLVLAGCNGHAVGVDVTNGRIIWKYDLPVMRYQSVTLLLQGHFLYTGSYGKVIKLDAVSGMLEWRSKIKSSQKCHLSLALDLEKNALVVGLHGRVAMLDLDGGEMRWQDKILISTLKSDPNPNLIYFS